MEPLTAIAVDLELSGRHVIAAGVATMNEWGQHSCRNFVMHGVEVPCDTKGPLLTKGGVLRPAVGDVEYRGFTKSKWAFWTQHPRVLASQLRWEPSDRTNADEWRDLRLHIDNIVRRAKARGARVRIVADNLSVDIGITNEHLKQVFGPEPESTLDHIGDDRTHHFVKDTAGPRWERQLGILRYLPLRAHGVKIIKHYAPHDALLCACEYLGYIRAYPMIERLHDIGQ